MTRRRPLFSTRWGYPRLGGRFDASLAQRGLITDGAQVGLDPGTSDFGIDCWVYPTSLAAIRTICAKGASGNSPASAAAGYWIYVNTDGRIIWWFGDGSVTSRINGASVLTAPVLQWTHLVVQFRRAGIGEFYVNGVYDAGGSTDISGQPGAVDSGANFAIGTTGGGSFGFDGRIDAFRFRTRALAAIDVAGLYRAGRAAAHRDLSWEGRRSVVSSYDLDGDFRDAFGPNHLTNTNGVTWGPGKV